MGQASLRAAGLGEGKVGAKLWLFVQGLAGY